MCSDGSYTFDQLPQEIHSLIFSFLDTQQMLRCMSVCRQWRVNVPRWTADQWSGLELYENQIRALDHPMHFLGSLVKQITIKCHKGTMQELIDRLDIGFGFSQLYALTFERRVTGVDMETFGDSRAMRNLGRSLQCLVVDPPFVPADIDGLLLCCPNLTHLVLKTVEVSSAAAAAATAAAKSVSIHNSLQYLSIHWDRGFDEMASLLGLWPNLVYLRINFRMRADLERPMSFLRLLSKMQKLEGLSLDNTPESSADDRWWSRTPSRGGSDRTSQVQRAAVAPLREFEADMWCVALFEMSLSILARHHEHLQRLQVYERFLFSDGLADQQLIHRLMGLPTPPIPSQLKELSFEIRHEVTSHVLLEPILKHCSQLERVTANAYGVSGSLPLGVYQGLDRKLSALQHLIMKDCNQNQLLDVLKTMRLCNVPLEHLEYSGTTHVPDPELFGTIAAIPTMKGLVLNAYAIEPSKQVMTRCFKQLRTSSSIESISFKKIFGFMSFETFMSLRKIPNLKCVAFHSCGALHTQGIKALIDRRIPLQKLEISCCWSKDNGTTLEELVTYAETRIPHVTTMNIC